MDPAVARVDRMSCLDATVTETRFPAMGNTAHVVVVAGDNATAEHLLSLARSWTASLEASWSRFIPTSDIYRLNTARGRSVRISPDTEVLVRHLIAAFEATDGLFDPFVLPALLSAGYDTSLAGDGSSSCPAGHRPRDVTREHVVLESVEGETWCRLLDGATLDPGGLGKGLASDIIAERLILEGALGALVSMGGDVRCVGTSPDPAGWVIDIEAMSHPSLDNTTIMLSQGAIATSSTHAKRWHSGHHIIDPSTGRPLREDESTSLRLASVVASTAVWAEVFATASLVAGAEMAGVIVEARRLAARLERSDGRPIRTTSFERFAR
jgi:thiamine biosynthesis lipoprotein